MNAIPTQRFPYPAWRTYLKCIGMLIPVVCAACFSLVFLIPKLKEIWWATNFSNEFIQGTLNVLGYIATNSLVILITAIAVLGLLEWRSTKWPRYRAAVMYTIVLLIVTGMFVFLLSMLASALMAAPHLAHS